MSKIAHPFMQKVIDYSSPRAAFLDSKVLLVGDALTLFRPHTAFSTNQATFDCLQMEQYVNGEIEHSACETEVLQIANLHWLRSVWWGILLAPRCVLVLDGSSQTYVLWSIDRPSVKRLFDLTRSKADPLIMGDGENSNAFPHLLTDR